MTDTNTPPPAPNGVTAGQGVEVKPLEWIDEDGGDYIAQSVIGLFHIGRPASFWNLTTPFGEVRSFETLEAAKAAAQAAHEQRILSALSTPTPKEESK